MVFLTEKYQKLLRFLLRLLGCYSQFESLTYDFDETLFYYVVGNYQRRLFQEYTADTCSIWEIPGW